MLINQSKTGLFTIEERIEMLREVTASYGNVRVESFRGLLVDFCRDAGGRGRRQGPAGGQ